MRSLSWNALVKTRIEPGKSLAVVPDPAVYTSGQYQLRYRIRASGKIFAQLVYKRGSKWETVTVAPVPTTEADADVSVQARLEAWRADGGRGGLVVGDALEPVRERAREMLPGLLAGHDPRGKDTLRALIDQYIKHRVANLRPRTQTESKRHLLRDWVPFHSRPAGSLTKGEIADHLFKLKEENGPVAALRSRATLHAMFAWAFDADRIEIMPPFPSKKALGVKERPRSRKLSRVDLRWIWKATEEPGDYNAIVRLVILSAQRRTVVGGMLRAELDGPLWKIPAERMKRDEPHEVTLPRQALEVLADVERRKAEPQEPPRQHVFGTGKGGFSGWSRCKERLDDRIAELRGEPLPPWVLHDARRSFRTFGPQELGIEPWVAKAILHHADRGMDAVYHLARYPQQSALALQRWADWLLGE
jgi:integrase